MGLALCVAGALALTVAGRSRWGASEGGNVMMVVGLQMIVGAVALGVASYFTEDIQVTISASLIMAFVYTTLVPGLAATFVWFPSIRTVDRDRPPHSTF